MAEVATKPPVKTEAKEGVDAEEIEADFKKGLLTVTLPKTSESLEKEQKFAIKAS